MWLVEIQPEGLIQQSIHIRIRHEIEELSKNFEQAQRDLEAERKKKEKEQKLQEEFMAKYEAFSDWLEDQASMINCLGKISSDLPILESQRHQIESLLNENENKKSRADRLEQIANELSDPDFKSKMGHLLDQWEALNGRLKDRRNKIDETIIILKKVEAQNKKVERFNQDAAELINDTIKIQPQLENIDEFISQVNRIPENHKNPSKIKLRRYSEGVLYFSKSVIFFKLELF